MFLRLRRRQGVSSTGLRGSWALGLAACVSVAACNPQPGDRPEGAIKRLSIATGGTGGVYYPYGGGIAKIISENLPGVEATAEATAASVDNLKFLRDGRSDIAFSMADTAGGGAWAGPFRTPEVPTRPPCCAELPAPRDPCRYGIATVADRRTRRR
jgi:TRAP transporter TAXI family solute receptor